MEWWVRDGVFVGVKSERLDGMGSSYTNRAGELRTFLWLLREGELVEDRTLTIDFLHQFGSPTMYLVLRSR